MAGFEPIKVENGDILLLDQRKIPKVDYIEVKSVEEMCEAIRCMIVRGAPLIGIAAAFGVYLGVRPAKGGGELDELFYRAIDCLSKTRPTAVNLFYALERMKRVYESLGEGVEEIKDAIKREAFLLLGEQRDMDETIGRLGAGFLHGSKRVLTHCNAGSLATGGIGTALGVIKRLHSLYGLDLVLVDETRPYLQGMRLTAFELKHEGIPYRIITDNSAGFLMALGFVDAVVVGADRIASNGDVANKIGTYTLAVLARRHNIPFVVAAPESTIDRSIRGGEDIPVEERDAEEVLEPWGMKLAPEGSDAINYSFDITGNELVTAIVTEKTVYKPPYGF